MEKIESFKINHDKLEPGMYISRIDGDVVTYDLRMKKPNGGNYIESATAHTLEHLLATLARNSDIAKEVVYVGPMGCRTGFYILIRDSVLPSVALDYIREWLYYICSHKSEYEQNGIPGATREECGNYIEHNLGRAIKLAFDMLGVLINWNEEMMRYPK